MFKIDHLTKKLYWVTNFIEIKNNEKPTHVKKKNRRL